MHGSSNHSSSYASNEGSTIHGHSNQSPTDLCMVLKTIQLAYSSAQIMIYQVINPSTTKSTMHGSLNHSSMHAQA